jgi:pimeloyl-[acyl-carrier protein] synthase
MMPAPEQPNPMVSADADVLTALFSPAGRDDPQAVLQGADVPGCRYAVVNAVLHDRRFAPPTLPASPDLMFQTLMRWMLRVDGDRHRRLRTRFGGLFTARRVEGFRMMVSARADELLDVIGDQVSFDLVDTFAKPLPFLVICDVMGVPDEQRRWLRQQTATLGRAFANQRDRAFVEQGNAAARALLDFFSALLDERAGGDGDDLLSVLGAEELTDDEDRADVVANCVFFIVAGHETTSTLIAAGADLLCQHPAQQAVLEADPSRWHAAVEEMLRFVSPTTFTGARARVDVEVEGERFEAGSQRVMFYAAANRDPRAFPDPDRFDIARSATGHVAFSAGPHYCLGAPLARMEAEIGLSTLFRRIPGLVTGQPMWRGSAPLRQIESLPCRSRPEAD